MVLVQKDEFASDHIWHYDKCIRGLVGRERVETICGACLEGQICKVSLWAFTDL